MFKRLDSYRAFLGSWLLLVERLSRGTLHPYWAFLGSWQLLEERRPKGSTPPWALVGRQLLEVGRGPREMLCPSWAFIGSWQLLQGRGSEGFTPPSELSIYTWLLGDRCSLSFPLPPFLPLDTCTFNSYKVTNECYFNTKYLTANEILLTFLLC